jgi:hypothetical protein
LLFALFLELEDSWIDGEKSLLQTVFLRSDGLNFGTQQMILSLTTSILDSNSLFAGISHPTMTTINNFRPNYTGSLSHGNNRDLNRSSVINYKKLFFKIAQINRPESYGNGNSHPRSDIATFLLGINDTKNVKLLLAQWGYLDSLQVL